ncbi:hypothetical protein F2Q70_00024698 [Brassica cretica]|uniref:Uncharacterized protein n=1 Tax=Brassica cretica TaxID=69181 RepID=A0A8S9L978_BRACR|nr:hypothetical protein F2Q70_00024698 [Brassica cretica]
MAHDIWWSDQLEIRGEREICGGVEDIERYAEASSISRDAESSKRAPETRNRRRDREREREADSSRETRNRRPEREATIPPIETSADAVDEEISSSRRDLRFAFGVASREREKTRR